MENLELNEFKKAQLKKEETYISKRLLYKSEETLGKVYSHLSILQSMNVQGVDDKEYKK